MKFRTKQVIGYRNIFITCDANCIAFMTEIFRELERLSLVNKLCTELSNHFGSESEFVVDKDVAEFIIHIAEKNATVDTFTKELSENGAEFTETFITNIHRIIHTHLDRIKLRKDETTLPSADNTLRDVNGEEIQVDPSLIYRETLHEETKLKFPALCIKDDPESAKTFLQSKEGDNNREFVHSTIMELEALRNKGLELDVKDKSDKKRDKEKLRHKERRHRDRTHSRSPMKRHHRRSRSRSPTATRHRGRDRNRENSPERYHRYRTRSLTPLQDNPVVGSIYKGSVTGVLRYGCFVSLKGVKRKCEGLVHVSQLLGGGVRVSNPEEVVQRGDPVFVKVLNITGDKMRLSMKEACQKTGNDLGQNKQDQLMLGGEIGRAALTHNPEYNGDDDVSNSPQQRAWTGGGGRQRVRCSSPEKWELTQLVAAGVMELEDLPWYNEETGILRADCQDDSDEDIEIGESILLVLSNAICS